MVICTSRKISSTGYNCQFMKDNSSEFQIIKA
jgi:hypothetical protein